MASYTLANNIKEWSYMFYVLFSMLVTHFRAALDDFEVEESSDSEGGQGDRTFIFPGPYMNTIHSTRVKEGPGRSLTYYWLEYIYKLGQ